MPFPLDLTAAQWSYVLHAIEYPEPALYGHRGALHSDSLETIAAQLRESLGAEDLPELQYCRQAEPLALETFEQLTAALDQNLHQAGERGPVLWRGRFRLGSGISRLLQVDESGPFKANLKLGQGY